MPNGYSPEKVGTKQAGTTVGASETETVVSKTFGFTAGGSLNCRIDFDTDNTTVAVGITAKVQHSSDGTTFSDTKSVAVSGDGEFSITFNVQVAADQQYLPLKKQGRLVITTGVGDTVDITEIRLQQEL